MDSSNGPYMSYGNSNNVDDLSSFFDGVQAYATNNNDTPFDSALFEDAFPPQSAQQPQQTSFNQAQRQTQSQSPALPQFKPTQNTYNPQQYGQNVYNPQSMAQQGYDQHLLSRPSHSPAPFDQYSYPQAMNYAQPSFDYRFNSFQPQRQPTPTQAFRPQVSNQAPNYMSTTRPPQTQAHVSQIQGSNGMQYTYQQPQRYVAPGMLNNEHQLYPNASSMPGARQMSSSPYLTMGDPTINPGNIQMQNSQIQQQHQQQQPPPLARSGSTNIESSNGVQPQHLHSLAPGAVLAPMTGNAVSDKAIMPKPPGTGKSSGSVSSSDDDLEIEDEPPEVRPAVITVAKPDTFKDKLLWEVVDAVWTPRNKPASSEKIVAAIKFIGESVRGLREQWKAQNEKLKKAELPNSDSSAHAPQLKQLVGHLREIMETLAARVTKWGHPSILKRLGENELLLSALYSFLADRVMAEDHNSTLVTSILSLGTKLQTVDEEKLEKVKWTKILSRIIKKSTNESRALAQQIVTNAKKATARKKTEAVGQGPASPAGSSSGQVAGIKRAREGGEALQQAPKKVNVKPSSKPLSVQLEEQRRLREKEKAKLAAGRDGKNEKPKAGGATVPARPKVAAPIPPKASPFASLMSASKKPGTSNAERLAVKGKPEPIPTATQPTTAPIKKEPPKPRTDAQPPKAAGPPPSSSFLGFIADMDKPKDVPKTKTEEVPNETPEAKAKRLRRETRRRLRVSWKPDQELVETRIFEHDPDEETGHEDSMMRDVGDTAREGEMLKRHHNDVDEMDEDDDEEVEYYAPYEVDFSEMKDDGNFVKTGGNIRPESACRDAQDDYESGRMMAVFASGERPNTPKEPPADADDEDFTPVADFGYPIQPFVRQREQSVMARRQAYPQPAQAQSNGFDLASALASMQTPQPTTTNQPQDWLRAITQQGPSQAQAQQPALGGFDISKILAAVNQNPQQSTYQAPAPTSQSGVPSTSLDPSVAALLASFNQQPQSSLPVGQGGNPNPWPGATDQGQQDGHEKGGKRKGKGSVPLDANGLPINYKTQVCSFWLEGKCTKGDACTYRHDHG